MATVSEAAELSVDLPGARAVFSTRRGGVSEPPFDTLNFGFGTDDAPANVMRNRRLIADRYDVALTFGRQVHGADVRLVDEPTLEPEADADIGDWVQGLVPGDGLVTATPGLAPMVLAADCLPVAIAGGGAVAMVHAGWQGLAKGVIAAGVRRLREIAGSAPLGAAIGPGAGPCCYEVSGELHERFAVRGEDFRQGLNLDLKAIARHQLHAAGVAQIEDLGLCTICSDPGLFFSHRRDLGRTGRQAGFVWLA
jgi:YfiH family protein